MKRIALVLIFTLYVPLVFSSCYDSKEIDETGYVIALGINNGLFTFQLASPLKMLEGGDNNEEKGTEPPKDKDIYVIKGENSTVVNLSVKSENIYEALAILNNRLSKKVDLSHLKIVVFSKYVAQNGIKEYIDFLQNQREIRPNTNLAVAENPQSFLTKLKPQLEMSTAKYYELTNKTYNNNFSVTKTIREFLNEIPNGTTVLPVGTDTEFRGMVFLKDYRIIKEGTPEECTIYNILSGSTESYYINIDNKEYKIALNKKPKIKTDKNSAKIQLSLDINSNYNQIKAKTEKKFLDYIEKHSYPHIEKYIKYSYLVQDSFEKNIDIIPNYKLQISFTNSYNVS